MVEYFRERNHAAILAFSAWTVGSRLVRLRGGVGPIPDTYMLAGCSISFRCSILGIEFRKVLGSHIFLLPLWLPHAQLLPFRECPKSPPQRRFGLFEASNLLDILV